MNTVSSQSPSHPILSYQTLSSYGFLAFPLAAAFIALQVLIPTHYAEITSLSLSAIGGIVLLARLWDTITDPIVGILSDRTPEHWGRRKLWIWLSIPLISLSTYMLFNPSSDAGVGYLLLWTFAIYVAGTMAIVPLNAWGAELSTDYQQRNRVTGTRALFGLLGTMAALSIPALLGDAESVNLNNSLSTITLLVIISLFVAAISITFVSDKHAISIPERQLTSAIHLIKAPSPFRTLLLSFLSNSIANAIPATLFLFYITYVLQKPEYAGPLLFLYFICAAISVPFWVKIAKRYGKHATWHASILIACLFFIATPFLGTETFWLYIIIVLVTGFTTGCDLIIPSSMNGDLVEWDAATTGHKRPGLFFALWGTTTKLAYALAIGIAFPLLDVFGFSADGNNNAGALTALAWMYGLPCIAFKVLALLGMKNYPITESEYGNILQKGQASSAK